MVPALLLDLLTATAAQLNRHSTLSILLPRSATVVSYATAAVKLFITATTPAHNWWKRMVATANPKELMKNAHGPEDSAVINVLKNLGSERKQVVPSCQNSSINDGTAVKEWTCHHIHCFPMEGQQWCSGPQHQVWDTSRDNFQCLNKECQNRIRVWIASATSSMTHTSVASPTSLLKKNFEQENMGKI